MARFELAEAARADLEAIADYTIERWGPTQAGKYLDALEARLVQLAEQPLLGRRRNELAEGLFSFPCGSHIVYYTRADFGIVAVRVLHSRQDPHRHID